MILIFVPCLMVLNKNLQNDIWFLLNSGRYVLENGVPYIEPFTIHQGLDFVMQQWLSACTFWLTYNYLGVFGLHTLVFICYLVIIFIIYKICMIVSEGYFFISFCITLLSSLMLSTMMTGRPAIFSTLILAGELYLLEKYKNSNNMRWLLPLPVLSLLLINLHAAIWPMIIIIIIPYLIEAFRFRVGSFIHKGYKKGELIISIVMMAVAGFVNPYGIDAITYLFKSYGAPEISMVVEEMRYPSFNTFTGLVIISSLFIIALIYVIFRKQKTKLRYVLLTVGTAILTLMATRNFTFFAICGVFPLAYLLRDIQLSIQKKAPVKPATLIIRKILIGLIIMVVATTLFLIPQSSFDSTNKIIKNEELMLIDTIQIILNEGPTDDVVLYTGYNNGGMAEFMGIPAYIDPRAEVFLKKNNRKEDILKEYSDLQSEKLYYKGFLDKYEFTHLILTKYDILYTYLKYDVDYRIAFSNEKYTLYERAF